MIDDKKLIDKQSFLLLCVKCGRTNFNVPRTRQWSTLLFMFVPVLALALVVQPAPSPPVSALIARARSIASNAGDSVWPGFARVPFPVLLVGADREVLYCPAGPAKGFAAMGRDALTHCTRKGRKRVFEPSIRATFWAVDHMPTVVIGMPAQTGDKGAVWVATLLHEHFHQMQMRAPGYQRQLAALDLAGSDTTGAWMLNFTFPYERNDVVAAFAAYAHALKRALRATDKDDFARTVRLWRRARRAAFARLSAPQRRYGEFQLWQEGVARYSEIAIAEAAPPGRHHDNMDFDALALNLRQRVLDNLQNFDMAKNRRVSFYALGAGEALLLDRLRPEWRARYFHSGLAMAPLVYETASPAGAAR